MIMGVSLGVHFEERKIKNKKVLFAPLFFVAGFIIVLLFRVFTAESHYLEAINSQNTDEMIKESKLSVNYWTFGEDEYRTGYHYLLSQIYKQKMLQERKDFSDEILLHLKQAIKHDKCRSLYWRELALMTSLLKNDKDKAIEYMERAISLYPTLGYNYLVFGDVYMVLGEKEEALKQYKTALKYDASLKEEIDKRMQDLNDK
jgi:tetratricopeptide (TPR) repeat protein